MSPCSRRTVGVHYSPTHPVCEWPQPFDNLLLVHNEEDDDCDDDDSDNETNCKLFNTRGREEFKMCVLSSFGSLNVSGFSSARRNPLRFFFCGLRTSASDGVGLGVRVRYRASPLTSFCAPRAYSGAE